MFRSGDRSRIALASAPRLARFRQRNSGGVRRYSRRPVLEEAPAPKFQPEVMTMFIREGASTIAAAVVRKAAIHFVRLVSL